MKWIELTVDAGLANFDLVASILEPQAPGGTAVEEWQSETGNEKYYKIRAYFPLNRSYKGKKRQIEKELNRLLKISSPVLQERILQPEDWMNSLKKHFSTIEIGNRIIIKPSWEDLKLSLSGRILIELDPGAAFGTGLHPTTRLCLLHLEKNLQTGMSVLDLGTGSGILAIAAAKLGASSVLAIDIDPVAVAAAKTNAFFNRVSGSIQIKKGSLGEETTRANKDAFNLILANITSRTISDLTGHIFKVLKPGAKLIASGIHAQGLDEVLIRLALAGFKLEKIDYLSEWYAVVAQKPE